MIQTSAIKSLSDFVRNSRTHINTLRETKQPEVLTVNGEAAVVMQDPEAYEEMAALADQARQDARLQEALNYFREGGKGIRSEDVFKDLETKYL